MTKSGSRDWASARGCSAAAATWRAPSRPSGRQSDSELRCPAACIARRPILYNSLAITLTAANRLDEALAAYRETSAIYQALGLGDGLDAQIVLGNTGTLELRTGHLREAEPLLRNAFERERALAGDSAAVAAAMGYYGKLLTITDRGPQAVATLREATALGERYAGANSPVALQNRLFLGEAQLWAGNAPMHERRSKPATAPRSSNLAHRTC